MKSSPIGKAAVAGHSWSALTARACKLHRALLARTPLRHCAPVTAFIWRGVPLDTPWKGIHLLDARTRREWINRFIGVGTGRVQENPQ
jgi:hypothetical protein